MPEQLDRARLIADLERDEGLRLRVYRDSLGIETIGIGRNLRDRGITKEEAYHLLNNDLESVVADLDQRLSWWRGLPEARQRVLLNMTFNMGIARLLGFQRFLDALRIGDYEGAAREMVRSQWAVQVGARANRLAATMRSGQ